MTLEAIMTGAANPAIPDFGVLAPYLSRMKAFLQRCETRRCPRVLANSMPKAGTNLLLRLLSLLPDLRRGGHIDIGPDQGITEWSTREQKQFARFLSSIAPGVFSSGHCYYFEPLADLLDRRDIKCVTIVRDPRDVCVSDHHYIMTSAKHRLHKPYQRMASDSDRLMASIVGMSSAQLNGDAPSLDIGRHFEHFVGWRYYSNGIVVRFEDLIGGRGGGDDRVQRREIQRVCDYLGIAMARHEIDAVAEGLFSKDAKTFRRGCIGDWRDEFNDEHRAAFDRVAGDVLDTFGYQR